MRDRAGNESSPQSISLFRDDFEPRALTIPADRAAGLPQATGVRIQLDSAVPQAANEQVINVEILQRIRIWREGTMMSVCGIDWPSVRWVRSTLNQNRGSSYQTTGQPFAPWRSGGRDGVFAIEVEVMDAAENYGISVEFREQFASTGQTRVRLSCRRVPCNRSPRRCGSP